MKGLYFDSLVTDETKKTYSEKQEKIILVLILKVNYK